MAMGEGRTKDKMRNTKFQTEKNVYFHLINKTKIQDVESVVEFSPTPMDGRACPMDGDSIHGFYLRLTKRLFHPFKEP